MKPSLLQRLRQGDQAAWGRFVDLFSPPLFLWAVRAGLQGPEAASLMRNVFAVVPRQLSQFVPGSPGGFRHWLRVLAHQQRVEVIRQRKTNEAATPVPTQADAVWQGEYLSHVLGPALEQVQAEFPPAEWKAAQGAVVEGRPANDVARETGTTVAAVRVAESKLLRRLRQEMDGLLD